MPPQKRKKKIVIDNFEIQTDIDDEYETLSILLTLEEYEILNEISGKRGTLTFEWTERKERGNE